MLFKNLLIKVNTWVGYTQLSLHLYIKSIVSSNELRIIAQGTRINTKKYMQKFSLTFFTALKYFPSNRNSLRTTQRNIPIKIQNTIYDWGQTPSYFTYRPSLRISKILVKVKGFKKNLHLPNIKKIPKTISRLLYGCAIFYFALRLWSEPFIGKYD